MSRLQTVRENWTEITTKLLRDKQELAHFLRFSAKMYKQSFSDAVLIYQQNPSATKVATLETWNKLGRLVNKGEHSIAVFGEDSKCKHLFDVSQTNGKRVPELWKLTEDLSADLTAVINEKYGKDCKNIQETIAAVAVDNIKSRLPDMQYAVGQMKLSEKDITAYQQSIVSAVRFVIANRCELDSDMKISGGINLNAADMFKDSRDLIRFCNIVNQSAKDALLEMEREIVNILKQRRERSNDIQIKVNDSKENSEAYKAAKDKLEQRKREAGIKPKPVEYYAVRQTADRKFAVATISADGLVTVAKAGIATIEEAKKALLDIYKSKQSTVKCEFVHPQTLDEKSAEIYRSQTKELPAVTYRITPNPDKKSPDTHILQEYVKNGDDTYAIGKVMAKGDYEKCNSRLANLINPPKIEAPVKTFEIYQIRRVDETRDVRFEPYERLLKAGLKPDFKTYDKMYEADVSMLSGKSTGEKLESAFYVFNQERPEDFKGHSLSVSDVVVLDDTAYYVDSVGFKPLKDFIPLEIQQSRFLDTLPQTLKGIPDNAVELEAVSDKALKLNIPPEIIREACDMVNGGESLDNMANAYEEKFTEKNAPAEEAPEIEKPKPQKKPKL